METIPERSTASRERDRAIHTRLLAGDPTAPADLALAHLEPLVRSLHQAFPRVDPHLVESAAIDLLLDLAERPGQYDPARGGLAGYLRMAARRDVANALRKEQRRARRHVQLEHVELAHRVGNSAIDEALDPADDVMRAQPLDPELLAALRAAFDATEWPIVQLMLEGERRTAVYADTLGLVPEPGLEQAREVKRVKDRLRKRLIRLAPLVRRDG